MNQSIIPHCSATTLSTFELFVNLTNIEREQIAKEMSVQRFERHRFVIKNKELSSDVHFIVSGVIRACAYSVDGKQVQFEDLHAGAIFGELAAIENVERSVDCFAVNDSIVASLSAEKFRALIHQFPQVTDAVLLRLARLARRQMQRVLEFSTSDVAQRTRLELLRMAASGKRGSNDEIAFGKVPTHADIAARISTHREAVSKEIKVLEKKGLITWRPGTHVIHDVTRLAEIAHKSN